MRPPLNAGPIVRQVYREESLPDEAQGFARDTIVLGWEDRLRCRAHRTSENGVVFATALPRGNVLRGGDCFVVPEESAVVTVVEWQEPVLVIEPRDSQEWSAFAYAIGNGHLPLMITGQALICPDELGVRQVLDYNGIPFRLANQAFTPVAVGVDHRHR